MSDFAEISKITSIKVILLLSINNRYDIIIFIHGVKIMEDLFFKVSDKRFPAPTPDKIVENGEVHYGTFDAPFNELNLLDAKNPCGKMPSFMKSGRLVEWEAFEVEMDEGTLISAVYNTNGMGFSIFVWHDKAENKIYSWRNLVPKRRAKVAKQLVSDYSYCKTKHSEYRINNDFLHGKASAKGYTKGKNGTFSIDIKFERISPLANGVMPLAKNKDGSFRNPLYSEKDFFKATGTITLNGKAYVTNERSVGIIDDHKGYYPYRAHYDWLTTMGKINVDGEEKYFAFNLTRNQSVDQFNYNENVIWCGDESFPLPPVVFKHKDDKKKAREWHIIDEGGGDIVNVTFKIKNVFYMPMHLGIIDCYYALPFGEISGFVTDIHGKQYSVDGMVGVGEDKTTRM